MLWRFCLYGFLKNQRYFEPFLILAFLARGLSFFAIGLLVATREVTMNLLEVLSGALADTWGRRRSMVTSFIAYIASFVIFATAHSPLALAAAMALYGVGDAFRSGTHKAMILTWLRAQGREEERTAVYGVTRSWSKAGSAVSVIVATAWVLAGGAMDALFWMALGPYVLDLINLATYPAALEGEQATGELSARAVWSQLRQTAREVLSRRELRGLLAESSGFMGGFKSTKDYLQPVLEAAALTWLVGNLGLTEQALSESQRAALLIGPVYFGLFALSAVMSRRAVKLARKLGSEDAAARRLWLLFTACFAAALVGALATSHALLITCFIALYALEALWRPVIISRIDQRADEQQGATLLSLESQARSVTTMLLAPSLGALVDLAHTSGQPDWWPVAACGLAIGLIFTARALRR